MNAFEPLWGSWYLKEAIGAGRSGVVYRAEQHVFGHTYTSAVKHISIPKDAMELKAVQEELATGDAETLNAYFEQETRQIVEEFDIQKRFAGKDHFVLVHDILVLRKKDMPGYDLFIRMELLKSLTGRFQGISDPEAEARRLGIHICTALDEMHRMHYIHRDIKAQNILVSEDGMYKLADFGSARRLSGTSSLMSMKGTLDYLPPEFMLGETVGYNSDLYSLGLVLYRILNHWKLPFADEEGKDGRENGSAVVRRMAGEKLPAPSWASPEMARIILKACAYKPSDRYPSAEAMLRDLRALGEKEPAADPDRILSEIRREIEACRGLLRQEGTEEKLMAQITRLRTLPKDRNEVRDLMQTAEELAARSRKTLEDRKRTEAQERKLRELSETLDTLGKKLGEPETTAGLNRIRSELLEMGQDMSGAGELLRKCSALLAGQEKALAEKKTANLLKTVRQDLAACERDPGTSGTAGLLEKTAATLERMDSAIPGVPELRETCRTLRTRNQQLLQEKEALARKVRGLLQEMQACAGKIGEAETTAGLNRIQRDLKALDGKEPQVQAALLQCQNLLRQQAEAARQAKENHQLLEIQQEILKCQERIGEQETERILNGALSRLDLMDYTMPGVDAAKKDCQHLLEENKARLLEQKTLHHLSSLQTRLKECAGHIGQPETTAELNRIRTELNQLDAKNAGVQAFLTQCDRLLKQQSNAVSRAKAKHQLVGIQQEILKCSSRLGEKETEQILNGALSRLALMDITLPGVDAAKKDALRLLTENTAKLQAKQKLQRLSGLQARLKVCGVHIGQPETTAELNNIRTELNLLDARNPGVQSAVTQCDQLLKQQEQAISELKIENQLKDIGAELQTLSSRIGEKDLLDRLTSIHTRLNCMNTQKPAWKESMARCEHLMAEQKKALELRRLNAYPIPKSASSAALWSVGIFLFTACTAVLVLREVTKDAHLEWVEVILMFVFLIGVPSWLASVAGKAAGRHFQTRRISKGIVECAWEEKPNEDYGILRDGQWVSVHAKAPIRIEAPQGRTQEICLVQMDEKMRILKKVLANRL